MAFWGMFGTSVRGIVGPAALLVLGYLCWTFWGAQVVDRTYFSLKFENIKVTPQPVWIKSEVAKEVYEGSFLKGVSLLDRNAASTIANAFDLHPWVKRTNRVTKLPGGEVQVDLEYRQPIAMVGLDPATPTERRRSEVEKIAEDKWRFIPIDSEGVILPHDDKQQTYRLNDYLLVYAMGTSTTSFVGQPFGDSRIHDAVKLCVLLNPLRRELNIERIYVREVPLGSGRKDFLLDVATRPTESGEQRRVTWGHAPEADAPGETDIKTKLQRLYQFFSSDRPTSHSIDISGLKSTAG